ncbi:hypothetical protein K663_20348 (plasmid) [Sphingobium sp. MI1205]|nr:hypothetical protein K663_20348 [Sphingobium sp. MI1205]
MRGLIVSPVAVAAAANTCWGEAVAALHHRYDDWPAEIVRSGEGQRLSRFRYHNAESFCLGIDHGLFAKDAGEMLYQAGIVGQLAISSHLLDIGFADEWNARNIRLDVGKALAYANATGLGHHCPDMARLAAILSPYWKWGRAHRLDNRQPDSGGFTATQVRPLLRDLLDRVQDVTGHPRPVGSRREEQEAQA